MIHMRTFVTVAHLHAIAATHEAAVAQQAVLAASAEQRFIRRVNYRFTRAAASRTIQLVRLYVHVCAACVCLWDL